MTTRRQHLARLGALCTLSGGAVLGTSAVVSQEATRMGDVHVEGDASAFLGIDPAVSPKILWGDGSDTVNDLVTATNNLSAAADVTFTDLTASSDGIALHDGSSEVEDSYTVSELPAGATAAVDVSLPASASIAGSALDFEIRAESSGSTITVERSVTIEDSLAAYYPFEVSPSGTGGTVPDRSTNDNTGTTNGGMDTGNDGTEPPSKIGEAFGFDGSDDYVDVADDPSINFDGDFTIAAWTKSGSSGDMRIVYKYGDADGSSDGYALYMGAAGSGRYSALIWDDGTQTGIASSTGYDDGNWHHVAMARDDGTLRLYVDGVEVNSTTATGGDISNTSGLYLGSDRSGDFNWNGQLDDVRLYDRALPAGEIQDLYDLDFADETGSSGGSGGGGGGDGGDGDILSTTVARSPKIVLGDASATINDLVSATNGSSSTADVTYDDTTDSSWNIELYDDGALQGDTHTDANVAASGTASCDVSIPGDDTLFANTLTFDVTADDGTTTETQNESVVIEDGIVAYYPFEKTDATNGVAGDVPDRSHNSNDGEPKNSVSFTNTGRIGNSYAFDGASGIEVPDDSSLNFSGDFTIAAWAKTTSGSLGMPLVSKYSGGESPEDGYALVMDADGSGGFEGRLWSGGNDDTVYTSGSKNNDSWHHVAFVRDGSTIRIHVNGNQVDSAATTDADLSNGNNLYVGRNADGTRHWSGGIDDVRLYNRALSGGEIQDLYDLTFTS